MAVDGWLARSGRKTISVCCITAGPIHRVAAILALYRPITDEIICAVNWRFSEEELASLERVADRLIRCEMRDDFLQERYRSWLYHQCTSDWIVSTDSDEVPSKSLLKALGALAQADDVVTYVTTCRWLFPDLPHYLDEYPWEPAWKVIMVRNDPATLYLAWTWTDGSTEAGVLLTTTGTPQGGVISPLLANLYLHRLDKEVREAGFRLIRYADDFVILTKSRVEAQAADAFVREILSDIGLEVAEAKTGVKRTADGFEFLGFTFYWRFLRPRPRALQAFKDRVRERTRRQAPVSLRRMIEELNPVLRGWGNYFAQGDVISLFEDLDKWIRMRLRSKARQRFKSKGGIGSHRWPIKAFDDLGLVNLERLVRARKLSVVLGRSLG